ncbi:response regulator transcription factor [Beijerinckia mobilis]|uniref:response regulator transcription factor n=1 Tax=Beijerinckia mobilis TaxID=231434 RepID=UPI000554AB6E|nr:response regulator [Beijerinckia mobilis]
MSHDLRIAIIDDDEAVRTAIASLVRSLGYDASTFASATDFLQSSARGEVACLITDVEMPGMSGVELQAHLQKCGETLPIIFITAFPAERLQRKVRAAGAVDLLRKPFDGAVLIGCLEKALGNVSGSY